MSNSVSFDLLNGFDAASILEKAPVDTSTKSYKDDRFWKINKDANGNGAAIIRLLTDKNKTPFVKVYHYSSKKTVNGKPYYLIANSPSTIKKPCPIQEHYFNLINQQDEETAKKYFSRKEKYICNIYVVKDPANPENEGKVFLWEFGRKLKDKFVYWLDPSDEQSIALGETAKQLFNPISGNNIKLVIQKDQASGFYNYDPTSVDPNITRVGGNKTDEEVADLILNQTYDLSEFQSEGYFESYEALKEKLNRFINPNANPNASSQKAPSPSAPQASSTNVSDTKTSVPEQKSTAGQTTTTTAQTPTSQSQEGSDSWLDNL